MKIIFNYVSLAIALVLVKNCVQKIHEVEELTRQNTGMVLMIAADYGGQWDITQATKQLAQEVEAGKLYAAMTSRRK